MLNGIDVSSNQPENICDLVAYDFAIVKATGNPKSMKWDYKNPYMKKQVDTALKKTGLAGLYHFTWGKDANTEADLFTSHVKDYIGKVMLVIDYEDKATDNGREWLRAFIRRVKKNTGVNPVIYASSSVISSQRLIELCAEENCGIWSANYYAGYKSINGYDYSGLKMDIKQSMIWQYTSTGYLSGYNSPLDLDVFYGDSDAWLAYVKGDGVTVEAPKDKIDEDGKWGMDTTFALQKYFGTTYDGIISGQDANDMAKVNRGGLYAVSWRIGKGGSEVIRKLQELIGAKVDGYFGYETCIKFQEWAGTKVDGIISPVSDAVRVLQQRLNAGRL